MINIRGIEGVNKALDAELARVEITVSRHRRSILADLKAATPVDTGHARDSWQIEGTKIVNTAAYIAELNAGSSAQAPSHFIEKTVLADRHVNPNGSVVTYR